MLVLSRKVGEQIQIGDEVTVTVVRIAGGNVRLGIEAPPTTPIARKELQESIQQDALEQQQPDERHLVD